MLSSEQLKVIVLSNRDVLLETEIVVLKKLARCLFALPDRLGAFRCDQ